MTTQLVSDAEIVTDVAPASPGWAVAGCGAVTSVGADADETFEALCAGHSGLAPLRGFDPTRFGAQHAYEIDDRAATGTDEPWRATRWLVAAIEEAVRDAGLAPDLSDVPVIVGTGLRELRSLELWWRDGTPFEVAELDFHPALARRFGATSTHTLSNACSASLYALALGSDMLEQGLADTVVVAGVDSITQSMFGLLDRVQLEPPDAVRPFDRRRKGVLMGDGAAAVVLGRQSADGSEARAYRGRLRAVGINSDAYHVTAPSAERIAVAIREAHLRAGVTRDDIDLVLLHGTGTLLNDEAEARAVVEVFGERPAPLMTGIKSMVGHTSGGSGLLGLIVALRAIESGRIPPVLGLDEPIEAAAGFRIVRDRESAAAVATAQVHAFGFGGVNAVAIVEGARP
jgi:3-oxoacyl-[acyl-carrier-protein] synthase II